MTARRYRRRTFLHGLGGSMLAMPLLDIAARPVSAAAPGIADDGYPLRLVVFFNPNGCWPPTWFPTGGESDFVLAESMAPMEPFRDTLIVLDGVGMPSSDAGPGEDHQQGMGGVLTGRPLQQGDMVGGDGSLAGWGDGISVDQVIAAHIGATTPFASIEAGVRANAYLGSEVRSRIVYSGPAQPLPPEDNPVALWNLLFSELSADPTEMAVLRAKRVSVLDHVVGQFDAIRAKAGALDRQRLDQHADLVRDLELRLQNEPVVGEYCMQPPAPADLPIDDGNTMDVISRNQIDLVTMAFACDLTRVASIQYSGAANHITFPFIGSMSDGHDLSHAGNDDVAAWAEWTLRQTWYCGEFAYLLQQLAAIPEGETTMLDHTVILWVNELGQGNTHSHDRMPFVLAGSAGGHFRTGRYLQYSGASHNDLLVSLLNAFGIPDQTFGHPDFCTGALPSLT